MPRRMDELYWDLTARTDKLEASLGRAQDRLKDVDRAVSGGEDKLRDFAVVGSAAVEEMRRSGTRAAQELETRIASIDLSKAQRGTRDVIRSYIDQLERDFRAGMAQAKFDLARGDLSPEGFRDQASLNAEEFNRELIRKFDETAKRVGQEAVSDELRNEVANSLKDTGRQGGRQFSEAFREQAQEGLTAFQRTIRGGVLVGLVAAFAFAASRIGRAFRRISDTVQEMVGLGGEVQAVRRAFGQLAAGAGLDAVKTMRLMREATRGTTSELEIMRRTNEALQTGLVATEEELAEAASISRELAKSLGRDSTDAFRRFVQASVRGRRRILDDIGVLVDFETAHQEFAEEVGKSVDELTEQEKALARFKASVRAGRDALKTFSGESTTAATQLGRVTTLMEDLRNRTAEFVVEAPNVARILLDIGLAAEDAGTQVDELAIKIASFIDTWVSGVERMVTATRNLLDNLDLVGLASGRLGEALTEFFAEPFRAQRDFLDQMEETRRRLRGLARQQRELSRIRGVRTDEGLAEEELRIRRELGEELGESEESLDRINFLMEQLNELAVQENRLRARNAEALGEEVRLTREVREERLAAVEDLRRLFDELEGRGRVDVFQDMTASQEEAVQALFEVEDQVEAVRAALEVEPDPALERLLEALLERLDEVEAEAERALDPVEALLEAVEAFREDLPEFAPDEGLAPGLASPELETLPLEEKLARLAPALEEINDLEATQAEKARLAQAALDRYGLKVDDLKESTLGLARVALGELILAFTEAQERAAGLGRETDDTEEELAELLERVQEIALLTGGVLQLADAVGLFGDEAVDAMEDVANSTAQVIQGVQSLNSALAQGTGLLSALGPVGAIAGGVAGLVGTVAGLFGGGESDAERRLREALEKNAAAVGRLRDAIETQREFLGDFSGEFIAELRDFTETPIEAFFEGGEVRGTFGDFEGFDFPEFERQMRAAGLTLDDLKEAARALGLTFEQDRIVESFLQLRDALRQVEVERALQTFRGQMDLLEREMELFDVDDPIEELRRMRDVFLEFVDLPSELEREIAGLDLGTEEGRTRLEAILQRLFQQIAAGNLAPGAFGGLTLDDLLDALLDLEGTIDEANEAVAEGDATRGGFTVSRGITEVTGNRMVGVLTTISILEQQQLDVQRGILDTLGGDLPPLRAVTPLSPPAGGADGAGGVTTAGTSIETLIGTLQVNVDADFDRLEDAGDRIAEDTVREIDRQLRERLDRLLRATGRRN